MKRILILTAGFGEGHNTAARNVQAAVEQIAGDRAEAQVLDLLDASYGRLSGFVKKAYLATIRTMPGVWANIYRFLDSTKSLQRNLPALVRAREALEKVLAERKPYAVVSTYPVYNHLLDRIFAGRGRPPFSQFTIVTDSITVNSVWYRCASDWFLVPNEATANVMRRGGVPADKIKVLGFPVTHRFALGTRERKAPSDTNGRRVLCMINFARRKAPELLRHLLEIDGIDLSVTVGRNPELRTQIDHAIRRSGKAVRLFDWTDRLPELLMGSHLLIGKAGGATVQEAIAARTPMIVGHVLPGQEEGNARLIIENECGAVAQSAREIAGAVEKAFADNAKLWHRWHDNVARISRPEAAMETAKFILATENQ